MAYWCCLAVLRWWQFWRLPETPHSLRVQSARHRVKIDWVKRLWLGGATLVWCIPSPPFAAITFLVLTFLSFVLLDETA
ncbi:hypothetical protein [Saccharospirillum mangrovi]|uniref:hypothetical protein n=1 Tax=Saccharospirillum mangrovi TaxID=2161747 RepID=UPI000D3894CE|nr:hypothetical protein [Saccharospirillum mangrovi]